MAVPKLKAVPAPSWPTVAEIAASVPRSLDLRTAEAALASIEAERTALRDEMRANIGRGDRMNGATSRDPARIEAIERELSGPLPKGRLSLNERAAIARADRKAAQRRHGEAVAAALATHRRTAGERLAQALEAAEVARAELVEIDSTVLRHGVDLELSGLHSADIGVLTAIAARARRA